MSEELGEGSRFDLEVNRVAKGGAALGKAPDGRTTFVSGAIPGEELSVLTTAVHKSRVEAQTVEVLRSSPNRQEPACSHVADGCGGCDWQHISGDRQPSLRSEIVADSLRRLGKIEDVPIKLGPALPAYDYRTTVRVGVSNGRAAYRTRSSHDLVVVDECKVAHPLVKGLLAEGHFGDASEVTIRVGANTGERMVIASPTAKGVQLPDDVVVVGSDELSAGRNPHIHEELNGIRFQISADSFFQCRVDGALQLAQLASDALAEAEGPLLDAYCGVGLFGALAGMGRKVIGVESNPAAVGDARINIGPHATIVESKFERWEPSSVGVAIADPARTGLKAAACDKVAASNASHVVLISCDPASLARDAALMQQRDYRLDQITVVDMFPQTSHVETVSRFIRA